jgi:hypothetical protein
VFIVGFADTPLQYQSLLVHRAAQLTRARAPAALVVIDQESEAVIVRRDVQLTPQSESSFPTPDSLPSTV